MWKNSAGYWKKTTLAREIECAHKYPLAFINTTYCEDVDDSDQWELKPVGEIKFAREIPQLAHEAQAISDGGVWCDECGKWIFATEKKAWKQKWGSGGSVKCPAGHTLSKSATFWDAGSVARQRRSDYETAMAGHKPGSKGEGEATPLGRDWDR